jgi:hypothetical protein
MTSRAGWICASVLVLQACLEPNPNAPSSTDVADTDAAGTDEVADTTGSPACTDIGNSDQCAATDGCHVVTGSKLKENGPDSPCLEMPEFLGCIDEQACDDAPTWFCQGGGSYQVADSCGPQGFTLCEAPADPVDACP